MFRVFEKYPGLLVVLSKKKDGQMKLNGDWELDKIALANRKRFFDKLGIGQEKIVCANLVHGADVVIVGPANQSSMILRTDGLITNSSHIFLSLTVADCLPVFIFDPQKEVVALVHAGWRSLARNILVAAVSKTIKEFQSRPEEILAGIGPGIGLCHFEVKKDVWTQFYEFLPEAGEERGDRTFLDLKKIARRQLLRTGLQEENIEISPECTFCLKDKYFSARRDKPQDLQAMAAVIGLA